MAVAGGFEVKPGDVIGGKYRIERLIAAGGMGAVFEGRHLELGQRIAVKVMRAEEHEAFAGTIARFVRESRLAASIQSDHIARVTDFGSLPSGAPFMVMDLLRGEDLEALLGSEVAGLPVERAVDYVLQACEGLAHAHRRNVMHRDLKPANLFLAHRADGSSVVKLLDFGLSKIVDEVEPSLTSAMTVLGTPSYMSPEQVRGTRLDTRVDIWGLGVLLFRLLTNEHPFGGKTRADVCSSILVDAPKRLRELREDVPAGLEAVVVKCLAKAVDDRYPNVSALAEALGPYCPKSAARLERIFVLVSGPPTEEEDASPIAPITDEDVRTAAIAVVDVTSAGRSTTARRMLVATGGAALVLVVAAFLFAGTRAAGGSPDARTPPGLPPSDVPPAGARAPTTGATADPNVTAATATELTPALPASVPPPAPAGVTRATRPGAARLGAAKAAPATKPAVVAPLAPAPTPPPAPTPESTEYRAYGGRK
jgi:serine/threonine-protein kinase